MKFISKYALGTISLLCFCLAVDAQDTLPNFTLRDIGKKKVLISWTNPYPKCIQLAVQRSFDSTRFFSTIFSALTPNLPENGFTEDKMPDGVKTFYRIFYVLEGGAYFFSKSKATGFLLPAVNPNVFGDIPNPMDGKKIIRIYKNDKTKLFAQLDYSTYRRFRDSIITKTRDSIYVLSGDEILFKPFVTKNTGRSSAYVYVGGNGFLNIKIPSLKQHKYRIAFFEENGTELFEIKQVKEAEFVLDNSNFVHAGWFGFELYEDDKLKEKNKFYLQKPF